MDFAPSGGVQYPRCLGNGGVPVLQTHISQQLPASATWEDRAYLEAEGQNWARFGFTILDLDGASISVRYRDDTGAETHGEVIT
jgi:hypothetical protein